MLAPMTTASVLIFPIPPRASWCGAPPSCPRSTSA